MAGQTQVEAAFIAEYNRRIDATRVLFDSYAQEITNWMQNNAKWTDRTANARNSLNAVVEFGMGVITLIAQGGGPPDYLKYLELANGGKYAIVRPGLLQFAPDILRDLKRIWQ